MRFLQQCQRGNIVVQGCRSTAVGCGGLQDSHMTILGSVMELEIY
jgi:hypothetical protein